MEDKLWKYYRYRMKLSNLLILCLFLWNLDSSCSINDEGLNLLKLRDGVVKDPFGALLSWNRDGRDEDPCFWNGIECCDGRVVALNFKDFCLEGTLAPELGNLIHVKSIGLRNNSFSGVIPKEIKGLKNLELLDLGYNNFSGSLPIDLESNLSLTILLLDNNKFLQSTSPEIHELWKLSEVQVDENHLSSVAHGESSNSRSISWLLLCGHTNCGIVPPQTEAIHSTLQIIPVTHRSEAYIGGYLMNIVQDGDVAHRRLLQSNVEAETGSLPALSPSSLSPLKSPSPSPSSSPSPSPTTNVLPPSPTPAKHPLFAAKPPLSHFSPAPSSAVFPIPSQRTSSRGRYSTLIIVFGSIGAAAIISILVVGLFLLRGNKAVIVKPWATGLSGQLQKAFVTGVPKLKRSELEVACEDFSNVISSSSDDTVYKGTLSSGVEIAVTSTTVTSVKDWSKHLEAAFRKKIDTLSKVNHKNFVNLLGFCEEDEPFTRMMVFEYAPNGTLFEHLHIKESEHLDWSARLRIAMGISYCLEYMHQLKAPVVHKKLHSSTIYLTEDYAAKISDFGFWNEETMEKMRSAGMDDTPSMDPESNVFSFGVILLEMITGRLDDGPLVDWASEFLGKKEPVKDMVDPTLNSFKEEELEKLCGVITSCIHPDPKQRPTMREVTARLREITSMPPDGATPRLSPLWWAELEILSNEAL